MVGSGPGAFIGRGASIAARMDDQYDLVADSAVLRTPHAVAQRAQIFTSRPDRAYMAVHGNGPSRGRRPDRSKAVAIVRRIISQYTMAQKLLSRRGISRHL